MEPAHIQKRRFIRMSGYRPLQPARYRAWNMTVAAALILFCLPLIVVIMVALAVTQGPRNVFYRGERMGKDGKPFRIIKFKTLRDEAAHLTRNMVLPPNSRMETVLGKPLRETRLDELPQLFNVLLGDMNMLGPRPVRPAIAERCRGRIPNYDRRFDVKPGLIGYTQALMPHSADKAIRARVNALSCRRPVDLPQEILFVTLTGLSVLKWTLRTVGRMFASVLHLHPSLFAANLGVARLEAVERVTAAGTEWSKAAFPLRLMAVDTDTLHVQTSVPLPADGSSYALVMKRTRRFGPGAGRPSKAARCVATVLACEETTRFAHGRRVKIYHYTMRYHPRSAFQRYLIDRYFIGSVLVG